MLYLLMDEKKTCTLIKVGRGDDAEKRVKQYKTYNPLVEKISYVKLHNKDELAEKEIHFEMILLGFKRVSNTEWFVIPNHVADFIRFYGFNAFETFTQYRRCSYKYGTEESQPKPNIILREYLEDAIR